MHLPTELAKHLRDVHFGGNWTSVHLREQLEGLTWQQALTTKYSFNTIATLVYHMNYYVSAVRKVLEGHALEAKDQFSFDHPPINSQEDWEAMVQKTWSDAESFAILIEQLPEEQLGQNFTDKKYGHYYRNIQGIIEHLHYHLGQIVFLKKMILQDESRPHSPGHVK